MPARTLALSFPVGGPSAVSSKNVLAPDEPLADQGPGPGDGLETGALRRVYRNVAIFRGHFPKSPASIRGKNTRRAGKHPYPPPEGNPRPLKRGNPGFGFR